MFILPKFIVKQEFSKKQNNNLFPKGICASSFQRAWNNGLTGEGIVVAVIDTGIDSTHPDLKDKVVKSFNISGEPLKESHGTHVAGTIAANGWLLGGAKDAKLLDFQTLGSKGATIQQIVQSIDLAISNGANVINMSLGGIGISSLDLYKLTKAIEKAWNAGILCVAASGNSGISTCTDDPLEYPASIEKTESVGACRVSSNLSEITLAYFSNENIMVDLAACGVEVVSTIIGGGYAVYDGTSMATPHVSAMCAVLYEYVKKNNSHLKGANLCIEVLNQLNKNLLPIANCITNGKNISFGSGFIKYSPSLPPYKPENSREFKSGNVFLGFTTN